MLISFRVGVWLSCALVVSVCISAGAYGQVPRMLNFQGRILVNGVNLDGVGRFKFALVSSNGDRTYWSNDGTSVNGGEPSGYLSIPVKAGVYSVLLGDLQISGMSPIPASVLGEGAASIRIWFDDGVRGFQRLEPDQRLASVAYASLAATLEKGAVTAASLSAGSVTSEAIAVGAVGAVHLAAMSINSQHLADGSVAGQKLAPGAAAANLGGGGVPPGAMIAAPMDRRDALSVAGYSFVGSTRREGFWSATSPTNTPTGTSFGWLVDIGGRLFAWNAVRRLGGSSDLAKSAGIYDLDQNVWRPINLSGSIPIMSFNQPVWTGSKVLIWGGLNTDSGQVTNEFQAYFPAEDRWQRLSGLNAPAVRRGAHCIWTGSKFIILGGFDPSSGARFFDGGLYDPVSDSWSTIPASTLPAYAERYYAFFSGGELLFVNTGVQLARFAIDSMSWGGVEAVAQPQFDASVVVHGDKIWIWGGILGSNPLGTKIPSNSGWV